MATARAETQTDQDLAGAFFAGVGPVEVVQSEPVEVVKAVEVEPVRVASPTCMACRWRRWTHHHPTQADRAREDAQRQIHFLDPSSSRSAGAGDNLAYLV